MLKRLKIEGFRVHKKQVIHFDKHITSIRGLNDAGKSTVINALGWVVFNRPLGIDFINWKMKFARVTLEVDTHTIIRYRSKTKNYYKVDGKKLTSDNPGKGKVPNEVQAILKMGRLNFQNQRDPIFLLGASGGQISKELNSIINLDVMDDFLANVQTETKRAKLEEKIIRSRYREAKQKKKELEWITDLDKDLTCLEVTKTRGAKTALELTSLRENAKEVDRLTLTVKRAKEFIVDGQQLVNKADGHLRAKSDCETLAQSLEEYKTAEVNSQKEIPDIETLKTLFEEWQEKENGCGKFREARLELKELQSIVKDRTRNIIRLDEELNIMCKGKCPTCGNNI